MLNKSVTKNTGIPHRCICLGAGSERFLNSRESPRPSGQDPNLWTVEDVMYFIRELDPQLGPHAELFRKHVRIEFTHHCVCMSLWFKWPDSEFLCCYHSVSGNWREGSPFTAKWYDDEVHGPETRSRPKTHLPHRQAETGSLSPRGQPLTPPLLHQAHTVVDIHWSINFFAVVISECLSPCLLPFYVFLFSFVLVPIMCSTLIPVLMIRSVN